MFQQLVGITVQRPQFATDLINIAAVVFGAAAGFGDALIPLRHLGGGLGALAFQLAQRRLGLGFLGLRPQPRQPGPRLGDDRIELG